MGDPILADVLSVCKAQSVDEFWGHVEEQKQYIKRFYSEVRQHPIVDALTRSLPFNSKVWDKYQFDGIIAPAVAIPPLPHK